MALRQPNFAEYPQDFGYWVAGVNRATAPAREDRVERAARRDSRLQLLQGGLALSQTVEVRSLAAIGTHPSLEGIDQAWIDGEDLPDTDPYHDRAVAFGNSYRPDLLRLPRLPEK